MKNKFVADKNGYYGEFGGAFIPEVLYKNIDELKKNYKKIIYSTRFKKNLKKILKEYVGRPTPLFYCNYLSKKYDAKIYLKREDLNHTGAHKINNSIGQVLLAQELGKKEIIAETGAGQHGLATATACALMGLKCRVFMGEIDIKRQKPNVEKMQYLGAEVVPVYSGSKTLKDATNEAMREWIRNPKKTHYVIGSAVGPHPYPSMVTIFQSIISQEITTQLLKVEKTKNPNIVIACVGGGSNAIGAYYHFLNNQKVKLYGAEAGGKGIKTKKTAATLTIGKKGILHGSKSYIIQDCYGQITEPFSISAGLDYPGIGPIHSYLKDINRVTYIPINDTEAISFAKELSINTGIIPALESSHALCILNKIKTKNNLIVINLSGRGDKDINTLININKKNNE